MANFKTHYDNLKVSQNAPIEVIKASYKALTQKHHPDRNNNSEESTRIMAILNEAYDVLSDPVKRKQHDLWIESQKALYSQGNRRRQTQSGQKQSQSRNKPETDEQMVDKIKEAWVEYLIQQELKEKYRKEQIAKTKAWWKRQIKRVVHYLIILLLGMFFYNFGRSIFALDEEVAYVEPTAQPSEEPTQYADDASEATAVDPDNPYEPSNVIIDNSAKEEFEAAIQSIAAPIEAQEAALEATKAQENYNLSSTNYHTSFDCNKAKSISEQLICSNEYLAGQDLELSQLVDEARNAVTDQKALNSRLRKQWNFREKNCKDVKCLEEWYNYQKYTLRLIAETGNVRAGL
ncbi:TPA: DnaJ domain-containing protein [Acinetobacter baumannii]